MLILEMVAPLARNVLTSDGGSYLAPDYPQLFCSVDAFEVGVVIHMKDHILDR